MTQKVQDLAPLIWQEIEKAKHILVHCHPGPDGDSIGSAIATLLTLTKAGKKVTAIRGDSEPAHEFSLLPGYEQLIPKNIFEIDLNDFDLFLILDSGGLNQVSKKGEVIFPDTLQTIVIDHHASNPGFGKINLVDTSYPALCQLLFDLFELWKLEIPAQAAMWMFIGIYTDSAFKYPKISPATFETAAKLAQIYPDFSKAIFTLENNYEPGKIVFLGLALSCIEHYFQNKVALAAVPYEELQKKQINKSHTEQSGIPNILKSVVGWEIGISFIETSPGTISLSFRTRDPQKYDLSLIGSTLGGGGHQAAAGATLNLPFNEAKEKLLKKLQEVYPDLS